MQHQQEPHILILGSMEFVEDSYLEPTDKKIPCPTCNTMAITTPDFDEITAMFNHLKEPYIIKCLFCASDDDLGGAIESDEHLSHYIPKEQRAVPSQAVKTQPIAETDKARIFEELKRPYNDFYSHYLSKFTKKSRKVVRPKKSIFNEL